jgi:hypothetical protein
MGRKTNLITVVAAGGRGCRVLAAALSSPHTESGMAAKQRDRAREARHLPDMGSIEVFSRARRDLLQDLELPIDGEACH